jgi:hypothetical protein
MWTARPWLVVVVSLLGIAAGLVRPNAPGAATPSGPQDALHQVMPGDDLHLIAGYYYGDARQWERIWLANRDRMPNPNRIEREALLRIPDAAVPAESYADFVARASRPRPEAGEPPKAEGPPAVPPRPPVQSPLPAPRP